MIFDKRALLALGAACAAAGPFSRVGAVRGDAKSPLDPIARKLDAKADKPTPPPHNGGGHSTSKGGKNPPNSSKAHKDESTPFFVASAACAQKCLSAEFEPDHHLLTDAIQQCDAQSSRQMWHIVQVPHSTFVKVKSVAASAGSTDGWCLGVVPQVASGLGMLSAVLLPPMDGEQMFTAGAMTMGGFFVGDGYEDDDMCSNGSKLGLVSCDHQASNWSSTDGQLISPFCWGIGHSSFLSVNEGCTDLHLSTTSDGATAISRADTFMAVTQEFVETIPAPAPAPAPAAPTYSPTYMPTYGPTDGPTD